MRKEPVDLGTRDHDDVRDRDRETRPAAPVPRDPVEHVIKDEDVLNTLWPKTNSDA